MTKLRVGFYVLYILLGLVIVARMMSAGPHWELLTGIIFGVLLVALGAYRIAQFVRRHTAQ